MAKIFRWKDYSCVGDVCYCYRIPKPVDGDLVSFFARIGELEVTTIVKNKIYSLRSNDGIAVFLKLGAVVIEIRLKRSKREENCLIIEEWLRSYFGDVEIQEEA